MSPKCIFNNSLFKNNCMYSSCKCIVFQLHTFFMGCYGVYSSSLFKFNHSLNSLIFDNEV